MVGRGSPSPNQPYFNLEMTLLFFFHLNAVFQMGIFPLIPSWRPVPASESSTSSPKRKEGKGERVPHFSNRVNLGAGSCQALALNLLPGATPFPSLGLSPLPPGLRVGPSFRTSI